MVTIDMIMRINENTCLGDLRAFLNATDNIGAISDAQPIAHHDEDGDLVGLSIVAGGNHER